MRISQDLSLLDACANWPGLRTRVLVKTARPTAQGLTHTQRFYRSSLADPATYARLVRGHCAVENQLHWQLDLTFKEDHSRLRTGHALFNANILRKTMLQTGGKISQWLRALRLNRRGLRFHSGA